MSTQPQGISIMRETDDPDYVDNQSVSATLTLNVSGRWTEHEKAYFNTELVRAIEAMWDNDLIVELDNEETFISLENAELHDPHPRVLIDRTLDDDPIVHSDTPLSVMSIDRPSDNRGLVEQMTEGHDPDMALVPLEVNEPNEPDHLGRFYMFESDVNPGRVQEFFDYGRSEELQREFIDRAKAYFAKTNG